jgi:hypothetical protein
MKLSELRRVLDRAAEKAGDVDDEVEVWINEYQMCRIVRVGQFSVVPTVTLSLGEIVMDLTPPTRSGG